MGFFGLFKKKTNPENSKNKNAKTISETKHKTTKFENQTNNLKNSSAIIDASYKEIVASLGDDLTEELLKPMLNTFHAFAPLMSNLSQEQILNDNGSELSTQGKLEESLQLYDKALAIAPNNELILLNKSRVMYLLGQTAESMIFVDKALDVNPDFYDALFVKGLYLSLSGHLNASLPWLDNAIALKSSKDLTATVLKIHNLMTMGQYEDGLNSCKKGLRINPRHELLLVLKAKLLLLMHNLSDGYECVLDILDIYPKNQWVLSSRKTISEVLKNQRKKIG